MVRSRLQQEVLVLYRKCLVAAKEKPGFISTIKQEFRKHAAIPKNETMRIEFLLRNGQKKLEMIQDQNCEGMGHFVEKNVPCLAQNYVNVWWLGRLGYQSASRIQQLLAARHFLPKHTVSDEPNTIVLVEHPPVFTLGIRTSGYAESEEMRLKALGAEFFKTNRGGLITFHGPGQLVAYPVINLRGYNKSMKWYVCKLEETVIQMCRSSFGFEAVRSSDTGVWVNNNKICAIGVHGSRYITTHGIGLNCDIDLKWFSHIVPCGIPDKGVTSLSEVLKKPIPIECVLKPLLNSFSKQFHCNLQSLSPTVKMSIIEQLKLENLIDKNVEYQLLRKSADLVV